MTVLIDILFIGGWITLLYSNQDKLPCHRRRERTYKWLNKRNKRICARCFCMYGAISLTPLWIKGSLLLDPPSYWVPILGAALLLPCFIDGYTQLKKVRQSNNVLRSITGFLAGAGIVLVLWGVPKFVIERIIG